MYNETRTLQHWRTPFFAVLSLQCCKKNQLQPIQTDPTGSCKLFYSWHKKHGSCSEKHSLYSKRSHDWQRFYWNITIYKWLCFWKLAMKSLKIHIKHVGQERRFSHEEETKQKPITYWPWVCLAILLPRGYIQHSETLIDVKATVSQWHLCHWQSQRTITDIK